MKAPAMRLAVKAGLQAALPSGTKVFIGEPGEDAGPKSAWIESVSTEHEARGLAPNTRQREFVTVQVRLEAYAERANQEAAQVAAMQAVDSMAAAWIEWVEDNRSLADLCTHALVTESDSGADGGASGWRGWWTVKFVAQCD